ncbi:hypothetical protein PY98_15085, partial [Lacticaseibacillus rhamnosus]
QAVIAEADKAKRPLTQLVMLMASSKLKVMVSKQSTLSISPVRHSQIGKVMLKLPLIPRRQRKQLLLITMQL